MAAKPRMMRCRPFKNFYRSCVGAGDKKAIIEWIQCEVVFNQILKLQQRSHHPYRSDLHSYRSERKVRFYLSLMALLCGLHILRILQGSFEVLCVHQVYDLSPGMMATIKKDNIGLVSRFICSNSERQRKPVKYTSFQIWIRQKVKIWLWVDTNKNTFMSDNTACSLSDKVTVWVKFRFCPRHVLQRYC